VELVDFAELAKLTEKRLNSWKMFKLTDKIELTEKSIPAPQPTPIYIMSMTSMIRNISVGQLGLAAWLCFLPALVHLPIS